MTLKIFCEEYILTQATEQALKQLKKSTNYKDPHYVVLSILQLLALCWVQITSSAPCSQRSSI
jgi:hypothetical protein